MGEERRLFPAFLDLSGRLAVVVGDGASAERKVERLVRSGADVVVLSADPTEKLLQMEGDEAITVEQRPYERGDLAGAALVLYVGDDEAERAEVADEAAEVNALLNVTGVSTHSTFTLPSVVRRGPLQIAVTTSGQSSALAKAIRRQLADEYGPEYGAYANLAGGLRAELVRRGVAASVRDEVIDDLLESDALERLKAGEDVTVIEMVDRLLPLVEARRAAAEFAEKKRAQDAAEAEAAAAEETVKAGEGADEENDPGEAGNDSGES